MIQHHEVRNRDGAVAFDVITSGVIPPNPTELLGSKRMSLLIGTLAQNYDYIIVDLPPVTSVSDAVIVSKVLSGIMIVVRNGYAEGNALKETVNQLKFVNAKILGFVVTFAPGISKDYKKSKYYKYYKQ